ncbi:MAG: hypothetical protein SCALA702_12740 [Melioribacteraceae bacterium]|nr:MAG: hypothetical protein SCALA702_12740 [Melioribacteraceae bacterium]
MKNIGFAKIIFFTIIMAILFFVKVFVANEIQHLTKVKTNLADSLNAVNGKIKSLTFNEYQKLTAKERIVAFASDSLNMMRADKPYKVLYIDEKYLKQITKIVNSKYD